MGNNGPGMHFFIVKKWCKVSPYCGAKGSDVMAPVFTDGGGWWNCRGESLDICQIVTFAKLHDPENIQSI